MGRPDRGPAPAPQSAAPALASRLRRAPRRAQGAQGSDNGVQDHSWGVVRHRPPPLHTARLGRQLCIWRSKAAADVLGARHDGCASAFFSFSTPCDLL